MVRPRFHSLALDSQRAFETLLVLAAEIDISFASSRHLGPLKPILGTQIHIAATEG